MMAKEPNSHASNGKKTAAMSTLHEDPNGMTEEVSFWKKIKKFLAYCGPGYMIAVGYMDPGNWITDIEAGSKYGYSLLYVILLSNAMAMVLQHLCIRLGIYTRRDLAQNCRIRCSKGTNIFLYIIAELAIIFCDLSNVIGTAIALNLLFGIPILYGVLVTAADVLLLLAGLSSEDSKQYKILELVVIILMSIVGFCFLALTVMVKPDWKEVLLGFVPRSTIVFTDKDALFSALGIIGATVMPHNLYLHSSIVKYRLPPPLPQFKADDSDNEDDSDQDIEVCLDHMNQPISNEREESAYWFKLKKIVNLNTCDTIFALFLALLINAGILVVSAAAFNSRGKTDVKYIEAASALMGELLGRGASILFGLSLLAAGQSSTVTSTLAGQIVFEGFLQMRMKPWMRRLTTRVVAIAPAIIIIAITGEDNANQLLLYSQVVLSFQLPFAIIPLILFVFPRTGRASSINEIQIKSPIDLKQRPEIPQEESQGASIRWLKISSWIIATIIVILNIMLPIITLTGEQH